MQSVLPIFQVSRCRYCDIRFLHKVAGMSAKIGISAQRRENALKSGPEQLFGVKNKIPGHMLVKN